MAFPGKMGRVYLYDSSYLSPGGRRDLLLRETKPVLVMALSSEYFACNDFHYLKCLVGEQVLLVLVGDTKEGWNALAHLKPLKE